MNWYSVIKTIKGRQYLYRQRTFRVGGKVRTENQYVGAFGGDGSSAGVNITSFDEPEAQAIKVTDNTTSTLLPSSLQIDTAVQERGDLSMPALVKEEEQVRELMNERGLDTSALKPIRMKIGRAVSWLKRSESYDVTTTTTGHRTLTKTEYRTALGMRWIDTLREQDPERFAALQTRADHEYDWMRSLAPKEHLMTVFINWWSDRAPWKIETATIAGEMIQHGSKTITDIYYKEALQTEKDARAEWAKYEKLKQPKARRRQYRECQEAYDRARVASARFGVAIATRYYLYGETLEG